MSDFLKPIMDIPSHSKSLNMWRRQVQSVAVEDAEWLGEPPDDEELVVRSCIKYCPPDLHAVTCS